MGAAKQAAKAKPTGAYDRPAAGRAAAAEAAAAETAAAEAAVAEAAAAQAAAAEAAVNMEAEADEEACMDAPGQDAVTIHDTDMQARGCVAETRRMRPV